MEFSGNARKFSRVLFNVEATVKFDTRQFVGKVENLSLRGMFLTTNEKLAIGDDVEITIELNDHPENHVVINGRAIRIIEDGIAFIFDLVDFESYNHLKRIVELNSNDASKIEQEIDSFLIEQSKHL